MEDRLSVCSCQEIPCEHARQFQAEQVERLRERTRQLTLDLCRKITGDGDFDELLEKCVSILSVKGDDYTLGTGDRLHNFRTVAEFTGQSMEQVLATYLYKHMAAIFNHIKSGGQAESEPIEGRIADVVNYMLLFYKIIKEKKHLAKNI